jgi:hypothetical protein
MTTKTKSKTRPFKKFYCDRPNVFLIPAPAFKVWMYHYVREGTNRESWPSLPKICKALNMGENSVLKWRKWLIDNGWLVKTGERDSRSGMFSVPVMRVKNGTIPDTSSGTDGRRRTAPQSMGNGSQSHRTGKYVERPVPKVCGTVVPKVCGTARPLSLGTEVEPSIQVEPSEVKPKRQVDVGAGLGVSSGKVQTTDPFAAMREQIHGRPQ